VATFSIHVAVGAAEEIARLAAFHRCHVMDAIVKSLSAERTRAARHRKRLRPVRAGFEHVAPLWQLRIGVFRVFYDVDEERRMVWIRAVRRKGRLSTEDIV
jgi:mRNA-degrading endonuclease RelE of RelBE toxin-antitoxin system